MIRNFAIVPGILDGDVYTEDEANSIIAEHALDEPFSFKGIREMARFEGKGLVIELEHDGRCYYPSFQFDLTEGRVYPVVQSVNFMLNAAEYPEGTYSWWVSPHGRLGCICPESLIRIRTRDHDLINLARALGSDAGL